MTTTTRTEPKPGSNGGSADQHRRVRDLALAPPDRGVRFRELAVGAGVIVLFALAGVLWHLRSIDKVPALAVAAGLERGETIEAGDLRLTYVSTDGPLARLAPEQSARVIGRTALVDLPAGTLLTEQLVVDLAAIGPDDGVVGLSLEPGQYPASDLAPGDVVDVIAAGSAQPVGRGEVFSVRDQAGGERKLVSLRASKAAADAVASLDQQALRLVWVAP